MRYITNVYEQTLMSLSQFDFQDQIYTVSSIRKGVKYDLKTLGQRISNLSKRIDDGKKYHESLEGRRQELFDSYQSDYYDDEYDCNGDY